MLCSLKRRRNGLCRRSKSSRGSIIGLNKTEEQIVPFLGFLIQWHGLEMSRKKKRGKGKPPSDERSARSRVAESLPSGGRARFAGWAEHPLIRVLSTHGAILLGLLTFFLYLGMVNHFVYFQGGDNAEYFMLARALAHGQGFTSTYIYPVQPHTKYPFLFPLMIAGMIKLFGENLILIKVLIALSAGLMAGASYRIWEDQGEKGIALAVALLLATIPFVLNYSVRLLSEIPFAAWVCLTLLLIERALKRDSPKSRPLVLGVVLALAAYFTRSAGIVLLPALAGAALLRSPVRKRLQQNLVMAGAIALPFLTALAAWFLRGYLLTQGQGKSYFREFFIKDSLDLNSPLVGFTDLIGRTLANGRYYLEQIGLTLGPFAAAWSRSALAGLGLLMVLIALIGWARVMARRRGAAELYAAVYSFLILVWNSSENRFLIPLYPVLLYYWLKGIQGLGLGMARVFPGLNRPAFFRALLAGVSLIMLTSNGWSDAQFLAQMARIRKLKGFEINPHFQIVATNELTGRILALAVYLRSHAEPDAVVFARKASLVALASDRPAIGPPLDADPAGFIRDLERNRVRYILVDEMYQDVQEYMVPALKTYPGRFQLVYQIPETQSSLYRFLPEEKGSRPPEAPAPITP
jgi:4-amino-4-deoxy-L-arabinose transferase-like glycosyltransferase